MGNSSKLVPEEPPFPSINEVRAICEAAVGALVARRGWTLLRRADVPIVAEWVMRDLHRRWQAGERAPISIMAEQSALGIYCERWVAACRADGDIAQTEGYRTISDYLAVKLPYLVAQWDERFSQDSDFLVALRQEILLKVRAMLPTLQTPRRWIKWLLRLSHTVIRAYITKRQGDALAHSYYLEEEEYLDSEQEVPPFLTASHVQERLRQLLAGCLHDELRLKIVEAFYLEGFKIQEMATQWGIESATISQAKFRALERLRRCRALLEFLEDFVP